MVELKNQSYLNRTEISQEEIDEAIRHALNKLDELIPRFTDYFASFTTDDSGLKYEQRPNTGWINGMQTGQYWLAYELTGEKKFLDVAKTHVASFKERLEKRIRLNDHDVGFLYSPSCVADYLVTGSEEARQIALEAAKILLGHFSEKGGFIIRYGDGSEYDGFRTIIDTMMNLPLLLWAWKETGDKAYLDAVEAHYRTTMKYLVRDDFSTYHHYQFDPETGNPVKGITWQGNRDESCWSRGHAWGVYGFPLVYSYNKDENLPEYHKNYTYYFLNQMPSDNVPYWDFDFGEGDDAPRDSSASAIAVCGLDEMCKMLPDDAPQKEIFINARDAMMKALIEKCANRSAPDVDGLIVHVTGALPQGHAIDAIAVYGDYFYLEALMRYKNPDWKKYW